MIALEVAAWMHAGTPREKHLRAAAHDRFPTYEREMLGALARSEDVTCVFRLGMVDKAWVHHAHGATLAVLTQLPIARFLRHVIVDNPLPGDRFIRYLRHVREVKLVNPPTIDFELPTVEHLDLADVVQLPPADAFSQDTLPSLRRLSLTRCRGPTLPMTLMEVTHATLEEIAIHSSVAIDQTLLDRVLSSPRLPALRWVRLVGPGFRPITLTRAR